MKKVIFISILLFSCLSANTQTFDDFINYVNSLPTGDRQAKVDSFMNTVPSFPFIKKGIGI